MNRTGLLISGIGIGAGLMYVLDPNRGNRRRAQARDKCSHAWHKTGDAIGTTSRDLANRTRGVIAEMTHLFRKEEDVADDVLIERVRSKMGRVASHPGAIEVSANNGHVMLSGPVLADEVNSLLKCVASVRGVNEVESRLDIHETAGDVPGLQGEGRRPGSRFELMQDNWSPAARLLTGVAGGAMAAYGATRQDVPGIIVSALGLCLLARGATNMEMKRMIGLGGKRDEDQTMEDTNTSSPVEPTSSAQHDATEKFDTARQRL